MRCGSGGTQPELLEDEDSKREAESFKEQGNAYYAKKDYNEAYNYYTKAIGEKDLVIAVDRFICQMLLCFLPKKHFLLSELVNS